MLLFILATIGVCHILVDGSLFDGFRNRMDTWSKSTGIKKKVGGVLSSILKCYQCAGFWSGVLMGLILFGFGIELFALGCAGSFVSVLGAVVIMRLNVVE